MSDESYVVWKRIELMRLPVSIGIDVRVRFRETQLLAIEFDQRAQYILFKVSQRWADESILSS